MLQPERLGLGLKTNENVSINDNSETLACCIIGETRISKESASGFVSPSCSNYQLVVKSGALMQL